MYEMQPEYYTGIEKIDQEHEKLFQLAQETYELLNDEFLCDKMENLIRFRQTAVLRKFLIGKFIILCVMGKMPVLRRRAEYQKYEKACSRFMKNWVQRNLFISTEAVL